MNEKLGGTVMHKNTDKPDPDTRTWELERHHLGAVAYRLLGSVYDAEDAVQETFARWYRMSSTERDQIEVPGAWRRKVITRICLDLLKSAQRSREQYVGEWLPEPIPTERTGSGTLEKGVEDPQERLAIEESVSMALLVVLEKMTPAERVSFVLHDVFRFSFAEIADILGRTAPACRQLASAARRRIDADRSKPASAQVHTEANLAFKRAWMEGDVARLIQVLDPSVVAITDGGGIVSAAEQPIVGQRDVARFFTGVLDRQADLEISEASVNFKPGLLAKAAGRVVAVISTEITDGRITKIWAVRNPQKVVLWSERAPDIFARRVVSDGESDCGSEAAV